MLTAAVAALSALPPSATPFPVPFSLSPSPVSAASLRFPPSMSSATPSATSASTCAPVLKQSAVQRLDLTSGSEEKEWFRPASGSVAARERARRGEEGEETSFGPAGYGWGTDLTTTTVTLGKGDQTSSSDDSFGPGDYGWGTDLTTTTMTVQETIYDASVTVYTVYEDAQTTITLTPNALTLTLIPTATIYLTSTIPQTTYDLVTVVETLTLSAATTSTTSPVVETVTVGAAASSSSSPSTDEVTVTVAKTSPTPETLSTMPAPSSAPTTTTTRRSASTTTPSPSPESTRGVTRESKCSPTDEDEEEGGGLRPTAEQTRTLYVIAIYLVGTTIAWNLWGLRVLILGFKSFTVFIHESGHALGLIFSAQPLTRFCIDPNAGGATHTRPGLILSHPTIALGQIFSILFGGLLVFVGFDTLASKYVSFAVMALWLPVIAFQANLLSRLICVVSLALLVGIWFIDHATGLRYYLLFLGVLSDLYILWDTMDDYLHRKQNPCCVVMAESNTAIRAYTWFAFWFLLSMAVLLAFVLGGLAYWRETSHAMYCQGQSFVPT